MHVTEPKHAPEGVFVVNPNGELCLWLAHLITDDPPILLALGTPETDLFRASDLILSNAAPVEDLVLETIDLSRSIGDMTDIQRTVLFNFLCGWRMYEITQKLGVGQRVARRALREATALLFQNNRNP